MNIFLHHGVKTPCGSSKNLFLRVQSFFLQNNYALTENPEQADYILFNTCGFLESIENEFLKEITLFAEKYKKKIIIFGCLGGISEPLKKIKEVVHIIRVGEEYQFDEIFSNTISIKEIAVHSHIFNKEQETFAEKDIFTIQIGRGCIHKCSFCATKRSIGFIKSTPVEEIKNLFLKGLSLGFTKIFLAWDDIASYGKDIGIDFSDLFNLLCEIPWDYTFLLDHTETSEFKKIFPKIAQNSHKISKIILPCQSFSDRKLALMERKYCVKDFLELVALIKNTSPKTIVANYIIYGYPTETQEEFLKELEWASLLEENIFFLYSSRPFTKNFTVDEKLSIETLKKRTTQIFYLQSYRPKQYTLFSDSR